MAGETEVSCYNCGCSSKTFVPAKNGPEACRFHPGAPIFHDAMKIWSCCNKKSHDFTDFLDIKGCTVGPHNPNKPAPAQTPSPAPTKTREERPQVTLTPDHQTLEQKLAAMGERPSSDEPMISVQPEPGRDLLNTLQRLKDAAAANQAESNEKSNGVNDDSIPHGTACKNAACSKTYSSETACSECQHHPGTQVFHEGLKFWSCCERKTTDFNVFLAQEGCTRGVHDWTTRTVVASPRVDKMETGNDFSILIFAKLCHPEMCTLKVNKVKATVSLRYGEQSENLFEKSFDLFGVIDPQKTKFKLGTKVEIKMSKLWPIAWKGIEVETQEGGDSSVQVGGDTQL